MNKKSLLIVSAILLLIFGGVFYLLNSSEPEKAKDEMIATGVETSSAETEESAQPTTAVEGSYVDYSDGVIASTTGTKLLFFHASWCPQCRDLESSIKKSGVPSGVTIIKVDYDTSQSLRKKYGVTIQTTVVRVDDNGDLVEKFVAYDDPSIDSVIKNLL